MARRSRTKKLLTWLMSLCVGALLLVLGVLVLFRFVNPPTSAFMLAYQWQPSEAPLRQAWVDAEQISPWMPLAVIASEDQRFPQHWGLDVDAIQKAVEEYRSGDGLRGASTITQQTAKNLFLWNGRSFVRKALEAGLALGLELVWSKQRILEVYLNIAEFGPGIYGVEAASRHYFGIPASRLSARQSARLAAVLPNPKVLSVVNPSAYVAGRVAWIRGQMHQLAGLDYLQSWPR
ncbi:monofunctional biosynthetic peptidoglycan transglycosylase [Marinobacter salinisoli]|uniref:Biosynthetic peptidoglycan transglycosylase n=1 Tax=Marinobacter salinisoli TaxID=2769486 RepID=A0ABX7MTM3_9GAMM|nr:monofunctional biosynthetic peptidoglycan transglycosylase [Marinobacter salinisoli]QSP94724.1 monofunctional biosynthetic peptidoglycan transglycosylase [Marinobacter salinisoli]